MSQTSFLESVVTWDERLCKQNVQEAVPKLISHLQEAAMLQEEIGILKIICVSFLPWVQIEEAEQLVFRDISSKGCVMLDKILDEIKTLPKHTTAHGDIQALLEVLTELLDCFTLCNKTALGAGNPHDLASIHSLPHGAIYLLKGTYSHCKDSSDIYGDVLASVTEPLSVLFKKAHALQLVFLGLLDNITISSSLYQQDIDDLCYVCQGLFEICQIVSSLDVKLVVGLWKAVSRLSGRHKNLLKDGLDVDAMVTYLCTEINKGYVYLLQLAPPDDDTHELSLSQGDNAAFQKTLKVLGYQLRVIISLLDSFIDSVSECVKSACSMVIAIFRSLPPLVPTVNISVTCVDEIRRHLVNGIEPLINLLIQNRTFVTYTMSQDENLSEDRLARLELLLKVADCLPKQTDPVMQKWMSYVCDTSSTSRSIFDQIFLAVSQCYIEMSMPLTVRTMKEVLLYEYICTHVCGLVGSLPARYFHVLEECLLKHLFSVNVYVSTLAEDIWCFMARFGSAELCYQHTKVLVDVCQVAAYPYSIVKLARRLVKFLAPDHQHQLLKSFPPDNSLGLWCDVFVCALPSTVTADNWAVLFKQAMADVLIFVSSRNKTYTDLLQLTQSLANLSQLLRYHGNTPDDHENQHSAAVKDAVTQLLALWEQEWIGETIFSKCLTQLIKLSKLLITWFKNDDFVKVFDLALESIKTDCANVKIATCHFLQACKKVQFAPDSKQPAILKKIPVLYGTLLQDRNVLVHHAALESFTQFAENTPYETLVPECLGDSQALQNRVVAFLSKTAEAIPDFDELPYLKQQHNSLCHHHQQQNASSNREEVLDDQKQETVNQHSDDESAFGGDMLDDIEEPALKRKRCHNNEKEINNIESVIGRLELNICELEHTMTSETLSEVHRNKLKTVSFKLVCLIDKMGS